MSERLTRQVEMVGRFEAHTLPNGEVVYYEPDPRHRYYGEVKENKRATGGYSYVQSSSLPGASTVAKSIDPNADPLMYWAAKLDQTGIAQLARETMDSDGGLDWLRSQGAIDGALRDAGLTWTDVRDAAATRGTNVHRDIFLALATETRPPSLSKLSPEERAYGQAAMRWWRDRRPTPLFAEQATMHSEQGYAGRFDLLCELDSERVLVDLKTREKGKPRKGDHVQLRGYEMANIACGIGASDKQLALLLLPDGSYREVWCVADDATFICALYAYRAGSELGKAMTAAERAEREAVAV